MNNLYDLHTWSQHYRQEALQEAQVRHLEERARADREQRSGQSRVGLTWESVLSLLGSARLAS